MKKLLIVVLFTLLFVVCQRKEIISETNLATDDVIKNTNSGEYSNKLNDLIYYDYGNCIKLSGNSTLKIPQLDLNLKDDSATIYVINFENSEVTKLYEYQPKQDVLYKTYSDGVYKIIAELSSGEIVDLTKKVIVETYDTSERSNGYVLLN